MDSETIKAVLKALTAALDAGDERRARDRERWQKEKEKEKKR